MRWINSIKNTFCRFKLLIRYDVILSNCTNLFLNRWRFWIRCLPRLWRSLKSRNYCNSLEGQTWKLSRYIIIHLRYLIWVSIWAIGGLFFFLYIQFIWQKNAMAGFEPWISGVTSDRSFNCATLPSTLHLTNFPIRLEQILAPNRCLKSIYKCTGWARMA